MTKRRQEEIVKEAFKEAATEWLDDKYSSIGKWTVRTLTALFVGALFSFIVYSNGWRYISVR